MNEKETFLLLTGWKYVPRSRKTGNKTPHWFKPPTSAPLLLKEAYKIESQKLEIPRYRHDGRIKCF